MSKIITRLLYIGVAFLCSFSAFSQMPNVRVLPANATISPGDTISVAVTAENFIEISGFSGTIDWNPDQLEFIDVPVPSIQLVGMTPPNCGGPLCSFSTAFLSGGNLIFTWFDLSGNEYTFNNGDTLWVMRYKALNPGITDLTFTSEFADFAVTVPDGMGSVEDVEPGVNPSNITVTNGGTGPCAAFPDLAIFAEMDSAATGQQVCVDISACNFVEQVTMSYTIGFNPALFQFDSVGFFNLEQSSTANFNTNLAGSGVITVSWFDSTGTGVNFPSGDPMYSICFTAIGPGGSMDTLKFLDAPTEILASDTSFMEMPFDTRDAKIKITGNATGAVTVTVGSNSVDQGDPACVDVTVSNFTDMLSLAYTMNWDPTVVTFTSIMDPNNFFMGNIAGSFDTSPALVNSGKLTLDWSSASPITQPNDFVLYQVCFDATGTAGTNTDVTITGDEIAINATQSDGMSGSMPITVNPVAGNVAILGAGVFTFNTTDANVCPGDTFCVEFLAQSFNGLATVEFTLNWDPLLLTYDQAGYVDLPTGPGYLSGFNVTQVSAGKIGFSWTDLSLNGLTFPDGDTLLQFCFVAIGGDGSTVPFSFTDDINQTGAGDINGPGPFQLDPGTVTISNGACGTALTATGVVTHIDCHGESTGSIDLTVSGGTAGYTFSWTGPGMYTSTDEDPSGLAAGTYDVTVTDAMSQTITASFIVNQSADIVLSVSETNNTCFGGTSGALDLTITGGTGAYTFLWDDTGASTSEDIMDLPAGTYCVTVTDALGCTDMICGTITQPDSIELTTVLTSASCNSGTDGAIDLTVTGGTGAYTYLWDDTGASTSEDISSLSAGTYCVTVTDANSCTNTICVAVMENAPFTLSGVVTDISCNGLTDGSIDLTVTGAIGSPTYTWDNGAGTGEDPSALGPNTYSVTVTADNCDVIQSFVVNEPAALSATATPTSASCTGSSDGSIDLTVSGGTSPFTYAWDNGAGTGEDPTGLGANTYCVTITDARGCTTSTCATVGEDTGFTLSAVLTHVSCNGDGDGSIDLTVTGSTGMLSYAWDNGAGTGEDPTNLGPNTYTVTVTDATCAATATYTINEPALLTASPIPTPITCNGGADGSIDLTVSGGTSPYTYTWNNGAGTGEDPSGLGANTYCVTVTDSRGCTTTTCATITEPNLIVITGTVTDQSMAGVNDGAIAITVTGGVTPYASFSWTGPGMFTSTNEDLTMLAPGTYQLTVTDSRGCTQTATFVVAPADAPTVTGVVITDAPCNGTATGAVNITVSGGLPPYVFLWDNSPAATTEDLTGVPAGTYSVTITDGNMVQITAGPYVVGEATPITYSETHSDASCNGLFDGEIHLTINGGNGPYTVAWNIAILSGADLVGLSPGVYTPTIMDANGCSLPGMPITIDEPAAISITIDQVSPVTCNGGADGAIDISIAGGTPGYSIVWSNGGGNTEDISGLSAGNYKPTVTDSRACTRTIPRITITQAAEIIGNAVITPISCNGQTDGAIDLTPTGGTGTYTFNWGFTNSEDVSGLSPGDYFVTIMDSDGCSVVEGPFSFTNPTSITINETLTLPSAANNDGAIDLVVNGGTPGYSYNWTGPNSTTYTGEPITGLGSGEYRVTVTDANGCQAFETYFLTGDFKTNGQVTDASCNGGADGGVQTFVQGGIGPYSYEWSNNTTFPNLMNVPAGTYSVTVTDLTTMAVIIESFVVGEPAAMIINIVNITNETGAGCNGSISISIIGGNAPYTYSWSNGATSKNISDVCKGNYTVAVTDAKGCFVESDVITVLAAPIDISNIFISNTTCADSEDGSAQIMFFGGCEPYMITLSNGANQASLDGDVTFTNLAPGNYVGNIFDNQGSAKAFNFTIGSPPPIVITLDNAIPNTGGNGQPCNGFINISVTGGTPPYNYTWSNGAISEDLFDVCGNGSPYSVTVVDANGCVLSMGGFVVVDQPQITLTLANLLDETCFEDCDGQISVTAGGGLSPFTYLWSNGATTPAINNLCPGFYTVTVTDANGTTRDGAYTVGGANTALVIQNGIISDAQGAVNNGSILLVVAGGVPPYTYEWSNGASTNPVIGLAAGVYNVALIDANGCVVTGAYTVESNTIAAAFEPSPAACSGDAGGGCLEVSPLGGQAPFTYQWSNGKTQAKICDLVSGTYTVTITDANALTAVHQSVLTNPEPITVSLNDLGSGTVEANVSGGTTPYAYSWNDSRNSNTSTVEGLTPGSYGVLVTDANGCLGEGVVDIRPEGECDDVRQVISPNGDGKNDAFWVICAFEYTDNSLEVYDRFGKIIFQADNYDNTWEGTDQSNVTLPEGGYFWVFKYRDAEGLLQTVKGHLTIIR